MTREDRAEWAGTFCLALLLAVMMLACAWLHAWGRRPPPDPIGATPVVIERLAPGETMWDLSREYAPDYDPRDWIGRCIEVNGWSAGVPNLPAGEPFVVVDWTGGQHDAR